MEDVVPASVWRPEESKATTVRQKPGDGRVNPPTYLSDHTGLAHNVCASGRTAAVTRGNDQGPGNKRTGKLRHRLDYPMVTTEDPKTLILPTFGKTKRSALDHADLFSAPNALARTRTGTPYGTTPSRWRVYHFHHQGG